ncbi:hypothetical protein DV735_g4761, partial [Chaetothyriales sp. CBS 134920]
MYWPCSVPQAFTARANNGITVNGDDHDGSRPSTAGDEGKTEEESARPIRAVTDQIVDFCSSRHDHLLASISASGLFIWSTRPTVVLALYRRSDKSIESYGPNKSVIFKPDSTVVAIHTERGYLLIFAIESDYNNRVLQQQVHHLHGQSRRQSTRRHFGVDDSVGLVEVLLRFRRALKIDAGINRAIATDNDILVATTKPSAIQCIRWEPRQDGPQTQTQVLSKLSWMNRTGLAYLSFDRAMDLMVWVGEDGSAYATRRANPRLARSPSSDNSTQGDRTAGAAATPLFDGHCFHRSSDGRAEFAAINARFSLIAVAVETGQIVCYAAKDYAGNIPRSHVLQPGPVTSASGRIRCLRWSPDGYCLFVGYEHGWSLFSVFGKEGASSFGCNRWHAETNGDDWLLGIRTAAWTANGGELFLASGDEKIWRLEMSRSAAIGCFSCANLVRALLQTPSEIMIYRGHELPDLTAISNDTPLWHHTQFPAIYLNNQHPIRLSVVSQDGRYVAIAGRRGLAHYSVNSGRWKTFADSTTENSFAVRGGMCWFNHLLAVATENSGGYDLRLYSRELELGREALDAEPFSKPIAFVGPSGDDSLLVYTHENILYHYIIDASEQRPQLVQVGQMALHGVVRAPGRVRSVSWVVSESQLRNGDPSRDVEFASVLFLLDDKLVLLQSSRGRDEEQKYELRVLAQHVEFYILMRDQLYFNFNRPDESVPPTPSVGTMLDRMGRQGQHSLRDSLWIFSGRDLQLWPDVREVLGQAAQEGVSRTRSLVSVPVDFYPLSILLTKGVVLGIEGELVQRRNLTFGQWRTRIRTQLFLPYVLQHQLVASNGSSAAAFGLAHQYQHLSYFPHALEILLHQVLDSEHERERSSKEGEIGEAGEGESLPAVLSFLQMALPLTSYLWTIVSCVRKTELSYWPTLFRHLEPPLGLFEQALHLDDLKTASGFLIIMHGLEEQEQQQEQDEETGTGTGMVERHVGRLMQLAQAKGDFEMCADLARFLIGVDASGRALRRVVDEVSFTKGVQVETEEQKKEGQVVGLGVDLALDGSEAGPADEDGQDQVQ